MRPSVGGIAYKLSGDTLAVRLRVTSAWPRTVSELVAYHPSCEPTNAILTLL